MGHNFPPEQSMYLLFWNGYLVMLSGGEQAFILSCSPKLKWRELVPECWTIRVMKRTLAFRKSIADRNWHSFGAVFIENKRREKRFWPTFLLGSLNLCLLTNCIKVSSGLRWRASLFLVPLQIWFYKYLVQQICGLGLHFLLSGSRVMTPRLSRF